MKIREVLNEYQQVKVRWNPVTYDAKTTFSNQKIAAKEGDTYIWMYHPKFGLLVAKGGYASHSARIIPALDNQPNIHYDDCDRGI